MQKIISVIILLLVSLLFHGCGRKQHNFLNFEEKKKEHKINRIILPSTKITLIEQKEEKIKISWKEISHKDLIGYNIYQFSKSGFVPKLPLNKNPIQNNYYISEKKNSCFLVRGVFKIDEQISEGPSSNILCAK